MRITKQIAKNIAQQLVKEKQVIVNKLLKDYQQFVTDSYKKQIPDIITETYRKHKEYFTKAGSVIFSGNGFKYERCSTTEHIICNDGYNAHLNLDEKLASKMIDLKRKWEIEKEKVEKLQREAEIALIGLVTFNRIKENFPEAAVFFPAEEKAKFALTVDLNKIRNQLKTK